jgi:hypothetical protein
LQLTCEENVFGNSFLKCEKSYILAVDSPISLDLTEYQESAYHIEEKYHLEDLQQHVVPEIPTAKFAFRPRLLMRKL